MSEHVEAGADAAAVADVLNGAAGQLADEDIASESAADDAPLSLEQELAAILGESSEGERSTGGESAPDDGQRGESSPEGEVAMKLGAIAEAVGVDESKLYEIEIPMPDGGESLTVGGLKDIATEFRRNELEREAWNAERDQARAAMATAREELAAMIRQIPDQFRTKESLEAARNTIAALRDEQARGVLERVPTWADSTAKESDYAVMREHLAPWGLDGELDGVYDARLLAYVRHTALQAQRLEATLARYRKRSAAADAPGKKRSSKPNQRTQERPGTMAAKMAAVGAELQGMKK